MINNKFLYGMAALALGLTACSSDEPLGSNNVAERDMLKFVKVSICTSGDNTRANVNDPDPDDNTDFANGTGSESTITSAYFAFYDAAGNWITSQQITNPEFTDYNGTDKPIEKQSVNIVPVSINKGQSMPAYVMCFINPVDPTAVMNGENGSSLEGLRNVMREGFKSSDGNFSMNNSVYYGTNELTGQTNVKISGTPIKVDQLYNSYDEADKDENANLDIYVERYCAKVNYNVTEGGIQTITLKNGEKDYKLTFKPEKWTINADEKYMHLVKKFATSSGDGVPTYDAITSALVSGWTWNQSDFFRSYWACSPNYYSTDFPQTSDQVSDKWPGTETGAGKPYGGADGKGLMYYSYNQITSPDKNIGKAVGESHYTLEGTMGLEALRSANPLACAPSALLVGTYTIDNDVPEGTTFYNVGGTSGSIYFDKGAVTDAVSIEDYFFGKQSIVFTKVSAPGEGVISAGDGNYYKRVDAMVNGDFVIEHPAFNVRTTRLVDESDVTLQLTTAAVGKYYIQTSFGQFSALTASNLLASNVILWDGVGVAKKFTNGKAYFSLPIMHLGASVPGAPGIPADKNINNVEWDKVVPGSFGIVRNHAYNIQIDAIKGLGTGIRDLDDPIVVPMKSNNYWFKYRINVQKWRIVPTQNATFD